MLHIPHYRQTNPQGRNSCVPAAIKMVLSVQGIEVKEEELCDLLETQPAGTPVLNVSLLNQYLPSCQTEVASLSFQDLTQWLQEGVPPIAFVSTGPLEHWQTECLHALIIVEAEEQAVLVHDPAVDAAPISVPQDIFLSAWNALANLTAIVKITPS